MKESNTIRHMNALESIADAIILIGLDKRIISINHAASELFGLAPGEAEGKLCASVVKCSLCGDPCPFEECLGKDDTVGNFNISIVGGKNRGTPICMHTSPMRDSGGQVMGVTENVRVITHIHALISELEMAYDEVENHRKRVQAILDSLSEAVITIGNDWKITSFNRSAENLTGIEASEAIGASCRDVLGVDLCPDGSPMEETLKTGVPRLNVETVINLRGGKVVPVSVSTALFKNEEGMVLGGVETMRNLEEIERMVEKRKSRFSYGGIIGRSLALKKIFDLIGVVKDTDSTVLITGESGTGKELFGRAIHDLSPRREGRFVKVNCAALTETLLESELFGHVKGAFTGATDDKVGRFEAADGGTVFLDEIGDVPLPIQVKLLRVLQDHEFERVGSSKTVKVDVRIIAATNRDLKELMKEGTFREDLFYRLNVIPIHVPSLRERVDDIPHLVEHIIEKLKHRGIEGIKGVSPEAMKCLMSYDWPGNVRELENLIERASVCSRGEVISAEDLPEEVLAFCRSQKKGIYRERTASISRIKEEREFDEREKLKQALENNRWNRGLAAKELSIDRTTLWRKMKRYGLL